MLETPSRSLAVGLPLPIGLASLLSVRQHSKKVVYNREKGTPKSQNEVKTNCTGGKNR